jgi:hypothetical protein
MMATMASDSILGCFLKNQMKINRAAAPQDVQDA